MEKTTVYFVADKFAPLFSDTESEWKYGGAEMQMYYLARGFARRENFQVVLLTTVDSEPSKVPNVTISRLKPPIKRGVPYLSRYFNKKRLERAFEVGKGKRVLILSQSEPQELLDFAKKKNIAIIYRINGDSLVDNSKIKPQWWIDYIMQRARTADAIVTQSNYQKDELEKNHGLSSSVVFSCYEQDQSVFQEHSEKDDFILWVGRCVWNKDPITFLNLAQALPDKKFVMVCPPEEAGSSEMVQKFATRLENVDFYDGVPHKNLMDLYRKAIAVVSTSDTEGLPNTLIEACYSYTPYISYRLTFHDIVGNNGIGLYSEGSFEKLKKDVESVFDDAIRERIAKKQIDFAKKTWNTDMSVDKYIKIIEEQHARD